MSSLNLAAFDAALKQHYTNDMVENLVYSDNPFLAMVSKYAKFGGRNLPIPLIHGNPQGRSATFATAQANKSASLIKDFLLTRVSDYGLASIDNETLEASIGDANAFMEAATTEIDGCINAVARSLAISMFRSGSGEIGQVNAEPSVAASTVITLKEVSDITNFEVGQVLNIWSAESGGTQRSVDGSIVNLTVSAVDRDAGTVTFASAYDASGTIAANDFFFVQGDRGAKLSGLAAWLPATAPTSGDSFFGVDRSVDATRLAGIRSNATGKTLEEAVVDAAARVSREGGKPDVCWMSYERFAALEKELGSKVQYVDAKLDAEIGFRGISINGPRGVIKCMADANCPSDKAYMLTMNTWKLYSLGEAPKILNQDGNRLLREASADAVEVRVGYYANLGCKAPGHNAVIFNFGA